MRHARIGRAWAQPGKTLSSRLKKATQALAAFFGQYPASDLDLAIELRMVQHREDASDRARLGIEGAKYQPSNPRVNHRSSAHGAGFQRDIESALFETVVFENESSGAQCNDFGVRGGVVIADDPVLSARNYGLVRPKDDGADGHFSSSLRFFCLRERRPQACFIGAHLR